MFTLICMRKHLSLREEVRWTKWKGQQLLVMLQLIIRYFFWSWTRSGFFYVSPDNSNHSFVCIYHQWTLMIIMIKKISILDRLRVAKKVKINLCMKPVWDQINIPSYVITRIWGFPSIRPSFVICHPLGTFLLMILTFATFFIPKPPEEHLNINIIINVACNNK